METWRKIPTRPTVQRQASASNIIRKKNKLNLYHTSLNVYFAKNRASQISLDTYATNAVRSVTRNYAGECSPLNMIQYSWNKILKNLIKIPAFSFPLLEQQRLNYTQLATKRTPSKKSAHETLVGYLGKKRKAERNRSIPTRSALFFKCAL